MYKNTKILGIGSYHPKKEKKNQFYVDHFKKYGAQDHVVGLMDKLGRNVRTLAREDETSVSMAVIAAQNALKNCNIEEKEIDMIIYVSDTPEYLSPCCALLVKNQLKAVNAQAIFDMNANCIGMLTAMDTAARYIATDHKYRKVLVVGALLISPQARIDDMVAYACTGDGAAAVILERNDETEKSGFLGSRMFTDDEYYWSITMPACGMSQISNESICAEDKKMLWKPFDFSFLSEKWSEVITQVLADHGYKPEDVSHFFMSQFSKEDILLTMNRLGVKENKFTFIADRFGYTGCTSPIMALDERLKNESFQKDDLIIFCSVASGYSMTALLYKW